jgi:uncharacterized protein (TIGR02145 family)
VVDRDKIMNKILLIGAMGIWGISLLLIGISCQKSSPVSPIIRDWTGKIGDADSNGYDTIRIGSQVWTVENLRTTKYNDGTPIPHVTDNTEWSNYAIPAYCYYNNTSNADSIKKFGALYNWAAVGSGKLAPAGWHVPSKADWDTLHNFLVANGFNWDGTTDSNKIAKSLAAQTDWYLATSGPGVIGNGLTLNNRSGFSGLPAGIRYTNGNFDKIGYYCYWWTSTETDVTSAYTSSLYWNDESRYWYWDLKSRGFSVRLVKDN